MPSINHHAFATGLEIRFYRETEMVSSLYGVKSPDPGWRYFDKNNHAHAFDGKDLPTLGWIQTGTTWVGDEYDGNEEPVGEYRCLVCNETVEPKYTVSYEPIMVAGPSEYTLKIPAGIRDQEYPILEEDVPVLIAILQRMFDR